MKYNWSKIFFINFYVRLGLYILSYLMSEFDIGLCS